jgi:hypothetical protein
MVQSTQETVNHGIQPERAALIAGVLAGVAGVLVFLVEHALWILPIWFMLPFGLVIELLDASGQLRFTRRFDAAQSYHGPDSGLYHFRETLPFLPGMARTVIRREGALLHEAAVIPNAPSVTLLEPAGGAVWDGPGPFSVRWRAEDADNDPLTAKVLYSDDGGATWQALAWTSSRDGALGTGNEVALTTLSVGQHTVTVTVTDQGGHTAQAGLDLWVGDAPLVTTPHWVYLPTVQR